MKHPLKTVAVSAVLSIALLSSAAYAALNTNAGITPDAKPAYAGQQFASSLKTDRDSTPGYSEDDGKDRKGGYDGDNDSDGNDSDSDGNDGDSDGNDGDSDGNDGDSDGNDGDGSDGSDGDSD